MQNAFSSRMVPHKIFESYTPVELTLKRMTLDNAEWTNNIGEAVFSQTKRPLRGLDVYFRQFINENFPLANADPNLFTKYVVSKETAIQDTAPSADYKLWHASLPAGQKGYVYPSVDHRDEAVSYNLLR
jgi:hypothetical protein